MNGSAWTRDEIVLLQNLWPTAPKHEIFAALSTHPPSSVEKKASQIKLRRRRVTRRGAKVIDALWRLRVEKGIKRSALCARMGYHVMLIGRWERGDARPSLRRLIDWCEALGVELCIQPINDGEQIRAPSKAELMSGRIGSSPQKVAA